MDILERRGARFYWREKVIARQFSAHLHKGSTVLDVGAGGGKLAQVLLDEKGVAVELIDVVDHNVTSLPLTLYDGRKLPYADDSFDTCLLVFVLHHADDVARLLSEVRRVARRQVIVVEDTPKNALERFAWQKWDYFLNHAHHEDIAVAHTARSAAAWQSIFANHGLKVVRQHAFRTLFPVLASYRHTAFILEK